MISSINLNDLINEDNIIIDEDNIINISDIIYEMQDIMNDINILNMNNNTIKAVSIIKGISCEDTDPSTWETNQNSFKDKIKNLMTKIIEFIKSIILKIHIFFVNADKYYNSNKDAINTGINNIGDEKLNIIKYDDYFKTSVDVFNTYDDMLININGEINVVNSNFTEGLPRVEHIKAEINDALTSIKSLKPNQLSLKESNWNLQYIKEIIDEFKPNGKFEKDNKYSLSIMNKYYHSDDFSDEGKKFITYDIECIRKMTYASVSLYSKISPTLIAIMKAAVIISKNPDNNANYRR